MGLLFEILFMHRQECQTPQLGNVALNGEKCAQRLSPKPVVVRPAPDLNAKLGTVLLNKRPQMLIRR